MAVSGIDTSAASKYVNSTKDSSKSSLDKDAFLQLLVTQMKYQDPLNPDSNTEYMSQLAQFSSLESMNNLNTTTVNNQALNLAGQYVIMNVTDSSGDVKQISGLVDYVTVSNGKALLSINDVYYSIDDLDSVVSLSYLEYLAKLENTDTTTDSDGETTDADTDATNTTETE